MKQKKILEEVLIERRRQENKWGQQDHDPSRWMIILMEEVGEASVHILESYSATTVSGKYRAEMIQVIAVALAAVECFDRLKIDLWNKGQ